MAIDYKKSGVDIEAGDQLVDWLKQNPAKTNINNPNIVSGIGGFASLFKADFKDMESPCLVSCTDGVGTKIKLATHFKRYREVAQDLVAMCVNDMICAGARPLFFLDYYSCGKLILDDAKEFLTGVRLACEDSDCALIGGETAEMPGVYSGGDFDCAGFSVGVVDQPKAKGKHLVSDGDQLIALASSGFHSNGFSLLRKLFSDDLNDWEDQLMVPTALYVKPVLKLLSSNLDEATHAMAHITGGGIMNIARVVPSNTQINIMAWDMSAPFMEVKKRSGLTYPKLLETLNCGIGYVLVVSPEKSQEVLEFFKSENINAFNIGSVKFDETLSSPKINLPEGWNE